MAISAPTILFADRDLIWGRLIRARLRKRSARVLTVTDTAHMLECATRKPPDLVVLDPGPDELDVVLRLLRRRCPDAQVIAVPTLDSPQARTLWRSLGIYYYHPKPGPPESILASIDAALGERLGPPETLETDRPHLICVDDDDLYLRSLNRILTHHGYRVTTFADPEKALEGMPLLDPDLAILDIVMPGMSGYDLADEIHENFGSRIPIVLLSARVSDGDIVDGYRHGASYYITKPCDPRTIINIVDYLVGDLDPEEREVLETQL